MFLATEMTKFSTFSYPGLRPFRPEESDIFFGREEQTDRLLERLQHSHFLAVVGPSGCGKSSLVRAGMITALETGFMSDAGSRWRIAEMRPGDRPISRLARTLSTPQALVQNEPHRQRGQYCSKPSCAGDRLGLPKC